jgi:NTE family protein
MPTRNATGEKKVLVLQGGGALGSYQAGAFEALELAGLDPDWIAGISIGSINAAIIAGNPRDRRVDRLRSFWELVSSGIIFRPLSTDNITRKLFNEVSAALVASMGAPGFFDPRFPPSLLMPPGSLQAISLYDTSPLKTTLRELIDFDFLNSGKIRCSVGAVEVASGNFRYFDSEHEEIGPEHIMASGALPPGFPPVEIEGKSYWDGGLVSNTPLQYVLDGGTPLTDMCIFQVDLFSARGRLPENLFDVQARMKEIQYSSRTRLNTDYTKRLLTFRRAIRRLEGALSDEIRSTSDWKNLSALASDASITIVHLIHRRAAYTTQSEDYEFSRYTVNEHWRAGKDDVERTLISPEWKFRKPAEDSVLVLDLKTPRETS